MGLCEYIHYSKCDLLCLRLCFFFIDINSQRGWSATKKGVFHILKKIHQYKNCNNSSFSYNRIRSNGYELLITHYYHIIWKIRMLSENTATSIVVNFMFSIQGSLFFWWKFLSLLSRFRPIWRCNILNIIHCQSSFFQCVSHVKFTQILWS